jgi:hypothetical protein
LAGPEHQHHFLPRAHDVAHVDLYSRSFDDKS